MLCRSWKRLLLGALTTCWEMRSLQMRDHFVTKTAITTNKGVPGYDPWTPLSCDREVEPTDGFEPSTCGLRNLRPWC